MGVDSHELTRALVRDVRTCDEPQSRLLRHLEALAERQDLQTQAAVFEQLLSMVSPDNFWVWFRMRDVYTSLGREDLAFAMARLTLRADPRSPHLHSVYREMFVYHRKRDQYRAAVDVFLEHARWTRGPYLADRWEVDPALQAIGMSLDSPLLPASKAARLNHRCFPATTWAPGQIRSAGGGLVPELAKLGLPLHRPALTVAELADAELFVRRDSVAVVDRDGNEHVDLSLGAFPRLIRDSVTADPEAERIELDEAVLVLDAHPAPNLCHFLLDQMPRLAAYRRAGARLDRAWVVGPSLATGFQQEIAARARIGPWLSTGRVARVRVGRLFVSSDCRETAHPAHLCAPWAIGFLRELMDAAATARATRKLFVSRADSPTRGLRNEAELQPLLQAHGYETIVPGRMAFDEQVAAFREASHVVATHGAALTHLVACAPGTKVLELFHPLYGTWAYAMLALACGHDYAALTGRDGTSDAPELNDPAVVGPTEGRFGERDLRIDPAQLAAWLQATE